MKNLSIHLTDQCNNSCRFCVVDSYQGRKEKVNQRFVYHYLKENANKGYERVNIHGGEPTVLSELPEILQYIRDFQYPTVSLQTNARLLSDPVFAKQICDLGVDLFVVSMHGKDAKQQDDLTMQEGSFQEAVQGIKNVVGLGKKVRTNTVVCKQNKDDLVEVVTLCMDLGAAHINISGMHPTGKAFQNFELVVPRYSEIISSVKRAADVTQERGVVCTLEGFPLCILGDHKKYCISWDKERYKLLFRTFILDDYDTFMRTKERTEGEKCKACVALEQCGGVYNEYLKFHNWDEFATIPDEESLCGKGI